jgi:hypothetical protein
MLCVACYVLRDYYTPTTGFENKNMLKTKEALWLSFKGW